MAQYVRLRLVTEGYNGKPDYWLHVREFTVDYETEDFAVVDTDIENTEGKYEIAAEAGKVTVALTDMPTGEIGNYLLLSLRDAVEISSVTISDTINEAMDITWSFDGKEYVSDFGGLQGLTYMKAVTKENAPATVSGEIVIEYVVYEEPSVSNNGKLDTYFASGTEGGYIEYTINKEVGLNPFTFTVIQNSETISNAKVEVKVYGTDEYVELGTLDKSICDFTLDPQTQVVRISWDAGEEFFIHEMFY